MRLAAPLALGVLVLCLGAAPASARHDVTIDGLEITGVVKAVSLTSITVVGTETMTVEGAPPTRVIPNATLTCISRDRSDFAQDHITRGWHVTMYCSPGTKPWQVMRVIPADGTRYSISGFLTGFGYDSDMNTTAEVTAKDATHAACRVTDAQVAALRIGARTQMTCTFSGQWFLTAARQLSGGALTTRTVQAQFAWFEDGNVVLFTHDKVGLTVDYRIAVPPDLVTTASTLTYGTNVVAVEKADGQRWLLVSIRTA